MFLSISEPYATSSDPNRKQLAPALSQLLLSSSSDEAVSNEVVELIGFDEIELVMEIMAHRKAVGAQVWLFNYHAILAVH